MKTNQFLHSLYEHVQNPNAVMMLGPKKGPYVPCLLRGLLGSIVDGNTPDIYFRLCPLIEAPEKGRGKQEQPGYLAFVWIDLDCGDKGNGKSYFPTKEEALKWVKDFLPWTYIVDSGNGLHVYCVLETPYEYTNLEEFKAAYKLSQRFQQWCREMCPYDIDSTHDLARVLRLPGSVNSGSGSTVSVVGERMQTVSWDLIQHLPVSKTLSEPHMNGGSGEEYGFVLDPNCDLNQAIVFQLGTTNADFAATWTGQRSPADNSPSAWRFSMLSFLLNAGLDVQDAIDTTIRFLIDMRKYTPDQIKLDRPELWAREVVKIGVQSQPLDLDSIEELIDIGEPDKQLAVVADLLGFSDPTVLVGISKFDVIASEENEIADTIFRLHVRRRDEVKIVTLEDPLNRTACQKKIWQITGIAFPHLAGKAATIPNQRWQNGMEIAWELAQQLTPIESDVAAQLLRSLVMYINNEEKAETLEEARETGKVFKDGDVFVVPTAAFNTHATATYPDLRSGKMMHRAVLGLRSVGVTKVQQVYKGVRMACLLVPMKLADEQK